MTTSAAYLPFRRQTTAKALTGLGFAFLLGLLAIMCGLIASTGNLIGTAVAVGLLLGGLLLVRLDLAVWLVLVGTLLINGAIGVAFHNLNKASWLFSLLGFFLLGGAMLNKLMNRDKGMQLPGFVNLLVIFMGTSIAISLTGHGGMLEVLVGTKRTFQLWGVMLVVAMMPTGELSRRRISAWCTFIFLLGFAQLPASIFDRLVLVPLRVGMQNGVVPIDIVTGTFEANMDGGGSSAIMIMFLIVLLSYVFSIWKQQLLSTRSMMWFTLILAAPMFLGETKLAVVLLPTMVMMIFGTEIRRHPVKAICAMIAGVLVTFVLGWLYLSMMKTNSMSLAQQYDKMVAYNFGSVGYYDRYSVNRTTAISFWYGQHGLADPVHAVFGHGIGSSYSGTGSLAPGHLSQRYPFMAINLTGLSTLLWDTGLFGTAMFLTALYLAWRCASRLITQATEPALRARLEALRVSLMCIAFSLMYSNSMFAGLSHECMITFTFGYLAWLARDQRTPQPSAVGP